MDLRYGIDDLGEVKEAGRKLGRKKEEAQSELK
jgi:hypothetical protein